MDTVTLFYELKDQGLGALGVEFFYSQDNETWERMKPIAREDHIFYQMKAAYSPLYVKARVVDAAGNEANAFWKLEIPSLAETPGVTPQPQPAKEIPLIIPILLAVVAGALLAVIMMRKK